ncbi:hypothetical protein [Noviherbaspirillum pedocola]|uniref:Tetratrico peptide repeat group 5 domain-containing protein n=1 Tax=Noviherbaspirillum pedocola TaxID=2801341 RepID=A0A934SQ34_9BURK|nr:hypothetical protein [Noviherbaspirillum pedocola]MBK4733233.1 hypothetical protein [Noviherbaspirillum pedocola]
MQDKKNDATILSPEEMRLLVEVGFLAAAYRHLQAPRIFSEMHTLRPDLSAPLIGLAMYYIEAGKASEAVAILQKAIANGFEGRPDLHAILGMALFAANRNYEAARLLSQLVSRTENLEKQDDSPEFRIAQGLLKNHASLLALCSGTALQSVHGIALEFT